MSPRAPFDPIFQTQLPLPLARLYVLAYHAREDRERHDHCLLLAEATLKLAASALVGRYRACGRRSERVDAALRHLSTPSLGQWRDALLETLRFLGEGCDRDSWSGDVLELLESSGDRRLEEALSTLADLAGFSGHLPRAPRLGFLDLLPTYRNAMSSAHGAIKVDRGPYRTAAVALLDLVHGLLEGGGVLGGARLVFAEEVRVERDGQRRTLYVDLSGSSAVRRPDLEGGDAAAEVLPGRLYLETRSGELIGLHPLLYYRSAGVLDQVLFLNRARRGAGGIQFLCYSTGDFHVPGDDPWDKLLSDDILELLAWTRSRDLDEASRGPAWRGDPRLAEFGGERPAAIVSLSCGKAGAVLRGGAGRALWAVPRGA
ncbi:MAG: hypothetical protein HY721_30755 [Planctomycetes bacterium]|nr:hypothetical protein [Planctomycetota bacterium]